MPAFMDTDDKKKKRKGSKLDAFDQTSANFDPAQVFTDETVPTIIFAIQEGKALRFGLTSDGGAMCIALYDDGQAKNFYVRSPEEIAGFFEKLYAYCKGSVD